MNRSQCGEAETRGHDAVRRACPRSSLAQTEGTWSGVLQGIIKARRDPPGAPRIGGMSANWRGLCVWNHGAGWREMRGNEWFLTHWRSLGSLCGSQLE